MKIEQEGHLWCTRTVKVTLQRQHTLMRPVQCGWKGVSAKFEPAWMILDDSTAVARRTKTQNCWRGASLMPPHAKNKCLIYANVIVSGTSIAGGQLGQVLACPEYPGRFYGRGKTGPDTDS